MAPDRSGADEGGPPRDPSDAPDDAFSPDPPATDCAAIDVAIEDAGAVGFVAIGGRSDPDLRYLTGFEGPEREYAFVRVPGRSALCAPEGYVRSAEARFGGAVAADRIGDPPGERAAAVLDRERRGKPARSGDGTARVLVPATIPHDAAVYLERGGYDLRSTTAVAEARATKTAAEVDAVRAVQRAAAASVRETERLLATATVGDDRTLRREGRPLTVERLRRATNAELARRGVTAADNTVVSAGTGGTEATGVGRAEPTGGDRRIRAGEPVAVVVAPRGPYGYHGSVARTAVVDSDGGWERRAYVAVESALDAALAEIEAGAVASGVGREVDAELAAFGFDPAGDSSGNAVPAPGYGVGLSRRERPSLRADAELKPGNVVVVEPRVGEPDRGTVRLSALVVVTADGYERLGDGDRSFVPRP